MKKDNGNALFLILIAVALFAALSYAITQSGRGGGNISKEKAAIAASQITQAAASVQSAVQRMIIGGIPAYSLCLSGDVPGNNNSNQVCLAPKANRVFNAEGGGAIFPCATLDQVLDENYTHPWEFRGIRRIDDRGFYIKDIGTNTNVSGRDAIAYLNPIHLAVCEQINKGLGLDATPADNHNFSIDPNGAPTTYDISKNVIYALPGQPFGCVDGSGAGTSYAYYHALIEQ